jgi:hypothetical protein
LNCRSVEGLIELLGDGVEIAWAVQDCTFTHPAEPDLAWKARLTPPWM